MTTDFREHSKGERDAWIFWQGEWFLPKRIIEAERAKWRELAELLWEPGSTAMGTESANRIDVLRAELGLTA